jgi:hypothetical protein
MGGRAAPLWIPKGTFSERSANRRAREALSELLADDFVDTVETFRRGIDVGGIADAVVAGGDVGIATDAIGLNRIEGRLAAQVYSRLNEAIAEGAELGIRFAPPQLAGVPVGLVNESAASWIAREGGALVSGLNERTAAGVQQAIREALFDTLTDQISPTRAAAQIGDVVGLTPQQVKRVANFRREITEQLIPSARLDTPATRRVIDSRVEAFQRRELRARGKLIADTEIQNAIQEGERAFWEVAGQEGAVDLANVTKQWMTVDDGKVCPICLPLHGQERSYDGVFELKKLGKFVTGPPAHPRCRCYQKYVVIDLAA